MTIFYYKKIEMISRKKEEKEKYKIEKNLKRGEKMR